jgi:hypothetical protein
MRGSSLERKAEITAAAHSAYYYLPPTHGSSFGSAAYRLVWSGPNKPIAPTKVKAKKTKDSDEMVEAVTPPQRSARGTQGTQGTPA